MKILFVCLGNICRSPLAEGVMKKMCAERGLDWEIDSAGLIDYHQGELPDERMRRAAKDRGYTLTHRSRPVKESDFSYFDLIIGMDDYNIRSLRQDAPKSCLQKIRIISEFFVNVKGYSTVPDPYNRNMEAFYNTVTLLEDACEGIIKEFSN